MEVHVSIGVRNPEWYWSPQKIKESDGYYEQWKEFNKDKVWKTVPSWTLKIDFDVLDYIENRNTNYEVKYSHPTTPEKIEKVLLEGMTNVVFKGKDVQAEIAISNSIIHSFFGAQKVGQTNYWYVYIKEDVEFEKLTDVIFVSKEHAELIQSQISIGVSS